MHRPSASASAAALVLATGLTQAAPPADAVTPFRVAIPDAALKDLHTRLQQTRWPSELPGLGWQRGVPLSYLQELSTAWRTRYDWRKHEAALNALPQFTTTIDGTRVHFIHVRSPRKDAVPLMLLHGWPGSVLEFTRLVKPLTQPDDPHAPAFHVVIPSLPGFGFSGPTPDAGWGIRRMAHAMVALMARVGHPTFVVHGNDTGALVARDMGIVAPTRLRGVHVTQVFSFVPPEGEPQDAHEQASRAAAARYDTELSWYLGIQSMKPQTLAYGLNDSPVAQLAWLVGIFKDFTQNDGRVEDAVDRDTLLTQASLYWFTQTGGSSAQVYAEASSAWGEPETSTVPTAVAVFPKDSFLTVRRVAAQHNRVVRFTHMQRGGHYPGLEAPDALAADIRAFVADLAAAPATR